MATNGVPESPTKEAAVHVQNVQGKKASAALNWKRADKFHAVIAMAGRGWHPTRNIPVLEVDKSFADKCLEKHPMWTTMGLDGLEGFEKSTTGFKEANLAQVKEQTRLESCTRVRVNTDDNTQSKPTSGPGGSLVDSIVDVAKFTSNFLVVSPLGRPIQNLDRFPFWKTEKKKSESAQPRDYGCSIAVTLYLRFNLQFAGLMVLAFLFSVPHIIDNLNRNHFRNQCRAALAYDYDALVANAPSKSAVFFGTNATANEVSPTPEWYADCGFRGKTMRASISSLPGDLNDYLNEGTTLMDQAMTVVDIALNGPLTLALGSCGEYSNKTNLSMPLPFIGADKVFVFLPDSVMCGGVVAAGAFWCDLVVVLLVLSFLIFLRRYVRNVAITEDKSLWTTGDYAVLFRDLRHGLDTSLPEEERMTANTLTRLVREDLEELGFPRECIHQIEVGRMCRKEVRFMKRLERANVQRQELLARKSALARAGKGKGKSKGDGDGEAPTLIRRGSWSEADSVAGGQTQLSAEMAKIMIELEDLYREPDFATGHAFVTFNYERDKLKLLKLLSKKSSSSSAAQGSTPTLIRRMSDTVADNLPWVLPRSKLVNPLPRSGHPEKGVKVMNAPEPSEVHWEALELSDKQEARMSLFNWVAVFVLLFLSGFLIIYIKYEQARQKAGRWGTYSANVELLLSGGLILASSTATAVTNFLLKEIIVWLTHHEGRDTKTEHEASLFKKLAMAYVVNSAAIPLLMGLIFSFYAEGEPIDQSWFEKSGVVGQVWLLLIINSFAKEFPKLFPVLPILQRHFIKAKSHAKLRKLWKPPRMYVADLYANTLKVCALGLMAGPLYPIAYLWAAFAMLVSNFCTSYGISRWYARPPAVDVEMMMAMRTVLAVILFFQIAMSAIAANSLGFYFGSPISAYGADYALFVISPAVWLIYIFVPLKHLHSSFRSPDDDDEALAGDTGGIHHDEVTKIKGYEMEPYICPRITERIYENTKLAKVATSRDAKQAAAKAKTGAKVAPAPKAAAKHEPDAGAKVAPAPAPTSRDAKKAAAKQREAGAKVSPEPPTPIKSTFEDV